MSKVSLTITYDEETQAVNVNGPLGNRLLCYGMMGMAADVIHEMAMAAGNVSKEGQPSKLIAPGGAALPPGMKLHT